MKTSTYDWLPIPRPRKPERITTFQSVLLFNSHIDTLPKHYVCIIDPILFYSPMTWQLCYSWQTICPSTCLRDHCAVLPSHLFWTWAHPSFLAAPWYSISDWCVVFQYLLFAGWHLIYCVVWWGVRTESTRRCVPADMGMVAAIQYATLLTVRRLKILADDSVGLFPTTWWLIIQPVFWLQLEDEQTGRPNYCVLMSARRGNDVCQRDIILASVRPPPPPGKPFNLMGLIIIGQSHTYPNNGIIDNNRTFTSHPIIYYY